MNLDELKKAAEAATPGPWRKACHGVVIADKGTGNTDDDYIVMWDDVPNRVETDATFIALANPATILALLTEREKLLKVVEAARASCSMNFSGGYVAIRAALKELDA